MIQNCALLKLTETILVIFFPSTKNFANRIEQLSAIDLGFLIVITRHLMLDTNNQGFLKSH